MSTPTTPEAAPVRRPLFLLWLGLAFLAGTAAAGGTVWFIQEQRITGVRAVASKAIADDGDNLVLAVQAAGVLDDDRDALDSCQGALTATTDAAAQLSEALDGENAGIGDFFSTGTYESGDYTLLFNAISDADIAQGATNTAISDAESDVLDCSGYVQDDFTR